MTFRTSSFITALLLCHLVVVPQLVTSQLRPAQPAPAEEVTIKAQQQEKIGDVFKLHGGADIVFRDYELKADEIVFNQANGDVTAMGHIVLTGGPNDLHIEGSRATYNIKTETGKFYDVIGTTGAKFRGSHVLLTSSNPFSFTGKLVEKVSRDRIIVHDGRVTSCSIVDAKWTFNTQRTDVVLGQNAKLYHSTFRIKQIPIFYFPFATLPVEKLGRQSGFLIPTIGRSSVKGTIIGDAYYWAINRSMDLTLGGEYFSQRGWEQTGTFRARPTEDSEVSLHYFGVIDKLKQGGEEVRLNADSPLPWGLRGVANIDYLSSYVFRLVYSDTFAQAVNSEVQSTAFLSKSTSGYSFNVEASRYQDFESIAHGDLITILHTPSIDLNSTDHQIASSPVYWSYDSAIQGVSRREPDFVTDNLVGRFDIFPRVSVPLRLKGWNIRPELQLRDTYYTQQQIPGAPLGTPIAGAINRRAYGTSVEIMPPALERIYHKPLWNLRLKHVIEPRLSYEYVNGVDNFNRIIRFDSRDILSDTNNLQYSVTNRIFARSNSEQKCGNPDETATTEPSRKASPEQSCVGARELLTWQLAQQYYVDPNFGSALISGQRNVFTTTEELTGIAFLTGPRKFSPIVSRLKISPAKNVDLEWHLDYDAVRGWINATTAIVDYHIRDFFIGGSQAFVRVPGEVLATTPSANAATIPADFNQFRWLVGFGNPNRRGLSAAGNIGYDVNTNFLQYGAAQMSYNWDCCGVTLEFRRLSLGAVRNENQYRFALNLTNLGTFGTLRRQERLF